MGVSVLKRYVRSNVFRNRHAEEFRISFVADVTFLTGQSYNYPEGIISYISVFIEKSP